MSAHDEEEQQMSSADGGERYMDEDRDGQPDLAPERAPVVTGPVLDAVDAKNRAWRTFLQGLLTDVLVALVLLLLPIFGSDSFDWTTTDWKVLGLSVAKTVVVTIISYGARLLKLNPSTITR